MVDWPDAEPAVGPPPADTIYCWRIPIAGINDRSGLRALVSERERDRLDRLRVPDDRRRFLAAHAGLRILLAAALHQSPQSFEITAGPHGKPALATGRLTFSIAHAGDYALIAIATQTDVGIDLEPVRSFADRDDIVARYFHPDEAAEIAAFSEDERHVAFFRAWTRKEAILKALGVGLGVEIGRIRVGTGVQPREHHHRFDDVDPLRRAWLLVDLDPAPGYVGALAMPATRVTVERRTLTLAEDRLSSNRTFATSLS